MLTLGVVSDVHFGPEAHFGGKLRKLTAHAASLLGQVMRRFDDEVHPDLVVNLGDDLEDESPELDRRRYQEFLSVLDAQRAPTLHVAGNHDRVHLADHELHELWRSSPRTARACAEASRLRYSLDVQGFHLVVLPTRETKDVDVRIDADDLAWLTSDLLATRLPTVLLMHHSASEQVLVGNRWFEGLPHLCLVRERAELRRVLRMADVRLVLNGHLHWNHLDVIDGVPFVTVQSLVENLDDDAPGRPACAHAVVRLSERRTTVDVLGADAVRYQIDRS
jgi:Icc protein